MYKRCLIVCLVASAAFGGNVAYGRSADARFSQAAAAVVMRQIGHQLLLAGGDDTSRILPVQQIAENEFRINFESPFYFYPDTLVAIVSRNLALSMLPHQYVVNVISCMNKEVIYGYSGGLNHIAPPCNGRKQPRACYQIQILFPETAAAGNTGILLGAGASLLALTSAGIWWNRKRRQTIRSEAAPSQTTTEHPVYIGAYRFYPAQQHLQYQKQQIALTSKETKLLTIFSRHLNELISREQLQKEGWEDEGVITGRSLDMYVSKLRRHLQQDAAVKLINVHGRGYRLETTTEVPTQVK